MLVIAAELMMGSMTRSPDCMTAVMVCAIAGAAVNSPAKKDAVNHTLRAGRHFLHSNDMMFLLLTLDHGRLEQLDGRDDIDLQLHVHMIERRHLHYGPGWRIFRPEHFGRDFV